LEAIMAGAKPVVAILFWRPLGAETFRSAPMTHVARGVFRATLPATETREDFEYYVEVTTESKSFRFPPTAPDLNQTIVRVTPKE
jgi:hypothetical protein